MASPNFLLFFLFLLFVINGVSTAHPTETTHQDLLLTFLQKPINTMLSFPKFLDTIKSDEGHDSSKSLYVPIYDVDTIPSASKSSSNSTPEDLLRSRLERDIKRVNAIFSSLQPISTLSDTENSFTTPVVSGMSQNSGEYFATIGVGTPPTKSLFVLDTGSDVAWVQCTPCQRCYRQKDPIFNPSRSSSYSPVRCNSRLCRRLDQHSCDIKSRKCSYSVTYGDGSNTIGDFATETLTFAGGPRVNGIALGCGHNNKGLFVAASGILGLGRGSLSFPSQLASRYGRKFSYCLVDSTTSSPTPRVSSVIFGEPPMPSNTIFTPLLQNPKLPFFYYVELTGFTVSGTFIPAEPALQFNPVLGQGGVIVDSGTRVTRLARLTYTTLRDAFRAKTTELKMIPQGYALFDTCYDLSSAPASITVPTVILHFKGGADVTLPARNYMVPVDGRSYCFAFAPTDSISIIGNIQQQGFRVVFDVDNSRVGFVPKSC